MKIAAIADLHLNRVVYKGIYDKEFEGIPFRSGDFMRSFRWMVDECINNVKPDLIVLCGDIYDYYEPTNEVRGFFSSQCQKIAKAKIPLIILIGNHDVCSKHHALKDIGELGLKNIVVVEESQILKFKDLNLLLFPYSLKIEKKDIKLNDAFKELIKKTIKDCDDSPRLLFGHCGIQGGTLNEYNDIEKIVEMEETTETTTPILMTEAPKKAFKDTNPNHLSIEDIDAIGAEYAFFGDFHKHHFLDTKKCRTMYTGSIEKYSMHEINQKKGFVVYDTEAEIKDETYGKCHFVEYPHCRPMYEFKGTLPQIRKEFEGLKHEDYQGAIVKVNFVGDSNDLIDFSIGLDDLNKDIVSKIKPIYLFHVQTTKNKEQEEIVSEIEKEIMDKGHISDDDVLDIVVEITKEKVEDEKQREKIVDLATEIHSEARSS